MNSDESTPSPPPALPETPHTETQNAPPPPANPMLAAAAYFANRAKGPEVIVRGGTTSSRADAEMAQKMSETKERWDEYDNDNKVASVPVERGGGRIFQRNFAGQMSPKALIKYVGFTRDVLYEMLCELTVDEVTQNHQLQLVCPECVTRGRPVTFSQIHLQDKNRAWHLDTRGAGEMRAAKNSVKRGGIEFYTYAGSIVDTDKFRCPNEGCGCWYVIDKDIMRRER